MSQYGDVFVVEFNPATGIEYTFKLTLDRPWPAFAEDWLNRNAVVVFGVLINRQFTKKIVMINGSIDANVSEFPPLRAVVTDQASPADG